MSQKHTDFFWSKITIEDKKILKLLLLNSCCIYGGYIRDIFIKKAPKDIDVVVFAEYFEKCKKELEVFGYDIIKEIEEDLFEFTSSKDLIPIDMVIEKTYTKEQITLSPLCYPDFDVNLLGLDSYGINNWTGGETSVDCIITNIKLMKAKKLYEENDAKDMEKRLEKIQNKGFQIVNYIK